MTKDEVTKKAATKKAATKRAKPRWVKKEWVVNAAVEELRTGTVDRFLATWHELSVQLYRDHPEEARELGGYTGISDPKLRSAARGPYHRRGEMPALLRDVLARLEPLVRRTGVDGSNVAVAAARLVEGAKTANVRSPADLAELVPPLAKETFIAAYEGSIGDEFENAMSGSSHRLRHLLLAHCRDAEIRKSLQRVLTSNLDKYVEDIEDTLASAQLRTRDRSVAAIVDEILALLDGYLIRAIVDADEVVWAERYAEDVARIVRYSIEPTE